MIEANMENKYNIALSIFLGIIAMIIFNKLLDNSKTLIVYKK
jgi:hypothetical protein